LSARSAEFAELVRAGRHDETVERAVSSVIEAAGGTLALGDQIGALRVMLRRVIVNDLLDGDPLDAAHMVARLVDGICETVRAERALSGGATDDLMAAVERVLGD